MSTSVADLAAKGTKGTVAAMAMSHVMTGSETVALYTSNRRGIASRGRRRSDHRGRQRGEGEASPREKGGAGGKEGGEGTEEGQEMGETETGKFQRIILGRKA